MAPHGCKKAAIAPNILSFSLYTHISLYWEGELFQKPRKISPQVPLATGGICSQARGKGSWNVSLMQCEWWFPASLCSPETVFSLHFPGESPQVCLFCFAISVVPGYPGYSLLTVLDFLTPFPPCSVLRGLAVPENVKAQHCCFQVGLPVGGTLEIIGEWRTKKGVCFPSSLHGAAGVAYVPQQRPQLLLGCPLLQLLPPRCRYLLLPLADQTWRAGVPHHPFGSSIGVPFLKLFLEPSLSTRLSPASPG